jgi:hypothetical protein
MTDSELADQLHRFAGYLDGTTPLKLAKERVARLVACHLKAIARAIRHKGDDCTRFESMAPHVPPADDTAF